jgi:dopamine D1-like receptor
MTFAVANDILGYWVFGETFCNMWLSFDVMCSTASILNLCAISLDRYIHIRSPLHYERRMTPRRTLAGVASLWSLSALISFLPIQLGWHRLNQEEGEGEDHFSCVLSLNPLYAVISSSVSFFIPCFVMVFIYVKLYQYARMHVKNIKRTWATGHTGPVAPANQPLEPGRGQYKLQDHKAAVTLGVIMGTFLFCWVPFFTINVIGAFCGTCIPPVVFAVFTWLGYLNSTMNPVIYSIFNVEFREAFKRVLSLRQCSQRLCPPSDLDFDKPIRANGAAHSSAYGTVSSPSFQKKKRKKKTGAVADNLLDEKITSV